MRILSWNIQDLFVNKPNNAPQYLAAAVGANNVGDFIAKVVACNNMWAGIPYLVAARGPIDIIVIIEVEEVAKKRNANGNYFAGQATNANYPILMQALVTAINNEAAITFPGPAPVTPVYQYISAAAGGGGGGVVGVPMVSTGDEAVGIIYNTTTVTPVAGGGGLMNDNTITAPGYLEPRTPFIMNFTENAAPANVISIVANHAPPTTGAAAAAMYQDPIVYTNSLQSCIQAAVANTLSAQPALPPNVYIMGDFNCSINRTYNNGAAVAPFLNLYVAPPAGAPPIRFDSVDRVNNTYLSSVKRKLPNGSGAAPWAAASYLNEEYDDILFPNTLVQANPGGVLDLVGAARNLAGQTINRAGQNNRTYSAWMNAYRQVSDHLPVGIEI